VNKTITKSIDENTQKSFFSKKNTFLIVLTFLLSLALVALTIIYILKIDWGNLFTQFTKGFGYQFSGIWFTLLLLFIP
jgi:predicted membrane-bound mannosyltransferase